MASQVIVPEECCLESVIGVHIYKHIWIPVVRKNLPLDIKEYNANDLKAVVVRSVGLLSATYQELVHWLQVLTKTHGSRLTFTTLTLATYFHNCITYTH